MSRRIETNSVKPTQGFDEYGGAEVNGPGSYSCLFRQKDVEPNEAEGKKGGKQKCGNVYRTTNAQSCHREIIKITHHKMIQYVHSSLGSFVQISQHFQYV